MLEVVVVIFVIFVIIIFVVFVVVIFIVLSKETPKPLQVLGETPAQEGLPLRSRRVRCV
jgi:heme/copper-type cytochrome/quinol oxidase subunit 2